MDDELEEDHHHHQDCSCNEHNHIEEHQDYYDEEEREMVNAGIKERMESLADIVSKDLKNNYKQVMLIMDYSIEKYSISIYHSCDGVNFQLSEISKGAVKELQEVSENLAFSLAGERSEYNIVVLNFENSKDEMVYSYDFFDINILIDTDDEYYKRLSAITKFYEDEVYNSSDCIHFITFKLLMNKDNPFAIEPAVISSQLGFRFANSFDDMLLEIYNNLVNYFEDEDEEEFEEVKIVIFPNKSIGIAFDSVDEEEVITRKKLSNILDEIKFNKYIKNIEPLIKEEIVCRLYPIEVVESLAIGVSKIGGSPDLPKGSSIPLSKTGKPLDFIAQINLDELSYFDRESKLANKGLLSFFYLDETKESLVIYTENTDKENLYSETEMENNDYLPLKIRFLDGISLPYDVEGELLNFIKNEKDKEKYMINVASNCKTKILGYPEFYEEDVRDIKDNKVHLLLQIISDREFDMNIPEDNVLYFWITDEDLKNGRYDKCWATTVNIYY